MLSRRLRIGCLVCALLPASQASLSGAQQQSAAIDLRATVLLPDEPTPASSATQTAASSSVAASPTEFPTFAQRRKAYLYDLAGPGAFVGAAVTAGFDQGRSLKVAYPPDGFSGPGLHPSHGAVPEWGEGFAGYSKRYASDLGIGLVGTTVRYGLGEVLRQDVTYHRCACSGVFPRAAHAVGEAFMAHTRSGRSLPSLPALASPYVGSEVAVVGWYPSRFNASDALRISAPLYIGVPLKNLFAEFLQK